VIRGQQLPFTMYCGLFGLNFPCSELVKQAGDERAREVCLDVGDAIVYRGRRNQFGHAAHDDHWEYDIPDACFFNVEPLMRAASVDPSGGRVYVSAAVAQLRAYLDVFLNRSNGLAHTIHGPHGIGKTFWCRAQGWLMWGTIAVLRGLSSEHPAYAGLVKDLQFFAAGVARTVDEDGAIHAFANDRTSLQETTGTAMVCLSLHEAIRRGWLDRGQYSGLVQKMWEFVKRHVTEDGGLEKVYVEWALPAELYVESSKTVQFGPHIGALLWLADELTTGD
jgi:rhamnogalacturonyl hydrolase YesR